MNETFTLLANDLQADNGMNSNRCACKSVTKETLELVKWKQVYGCHTSGEPISPQNINKHYLFTWPKAHGISCIPGRLWVNWRITSSWWGRFCLVALKLLHGLLSDIPWKSKHVCVLGFFRLRERDRNPQEARGQDNFNVTTGLDGSSSSASGRASEAFSGTSKPHRWKSCTRMTVLLSS